ncbi:NAD(P)-binding protein [Aspergillus pseudonomiae]|uniref:NAD(P)-binding protein n=1 Tax=Aspergillus pseudonomiae TaxID=1506151 RepID=A0A5N6IHY6_9EURO|nr:NAD(P)-binding protein [Aspergillus pseudonomiae]KAB8265824.1 NAD(P)-binding protein [Aspergillus pseudonomiae]KAE8399247.1 NAD(P)-binding protein [Aspergillus pseudonomiae]
MGGTWAQMLPGTAEFTDSNLDSQAGKVFIVTGGNAGIGLELVKMLYGAGATVYMAGRSPSKIAAEIENITAQPSETPGVLKSLHVDLGDLTTIAKAVSTFLQQESRLDVLWNNAGIAHVPAGSTSAQGYEAHMGTNCLGPYLFTKLLTPILVKTAESASPGAVRVVWATSSIVDMAGPPGGLQLAEQAPGKHNQDKAHNYSASKAGNWFLASELHKRTARAGITSVAVNPGNLRTKGWDGVPFMVRTLLSPFLHGPEKGAYTYLWAGLSPAVKVEDGGRFVIPWGRWHPDPRADCLESLKDKDEGGSGLAAEFWDWCDEQTRQYARSGEGGKSSL